MKTPIQEFIESITLKDSKDHILLIPTISKAEIEQLLEKEKEVIMDAYDIGWSDGNKGQDLNDLYYNETFKSE